MRNNSFPPSLSKEQNVSIDSPAWSGGQEKYTKYVGFHLAPLEAALPMFNFIFFLLKIVFRSNKNKGDANKRWIISFLKVFIFKRSVSLFSRSRCRKQNLWYWCKWFWTLPCEIRIYCIRSSLIIALISLHSIHQLVFLMDAHSVLCDTKLNFYTDKIKKNVGFRDFKPDHTSSQSTF